MSALEKRLALAWELRTNQRIEECVALVSTLKTELGIPSGTLQECQIRAFPRRELPAVVEVGILNASFSRLLGHLDEARSHLEQAESLGSLLSTGGRFHLCFEKGMLSFLYGHFATALEEFLGAVSYAENDFNRLCALLNALFCMENLALPYEKIHEQITSLLARQKPVKSLEGIRSQLDAFELRALFRKGKLRTAVEKEVARGQERMDQAKYYALWLAQLPYHSNFPAVRGESPSEALETLSLCSPYFQHRSYRLHTLQGILHPDDFKQPKLSELVDRLYLWVWRWLENPEGFPLQKILALFRSTNVFNEAHRLTMEDSHLLRNAVMWLGTFDPTSERQLRNLLGNLQSSAQTSFPLFELEALVNHYILAKRDGNELIARDFLVTLQRHPLWASEDLFFRPLVAAVEDEPGMARLPAHLHRLAQNLRALLRPQELPCEYPVIVDMNSFQILNQRSCQKIVSQPMCAALHLLRYQKTVSCREFCEVAFGLRHYDPLNHNGKIFNLLSRMKKVLPGELRFRMKSGFIIAEGNWTAVHFRLEPTVLNLLRHQPDWRSFLQIQDGGDSLRRLRPTPAPKTSLRRPEWEGCASRQDIESMLGKPRSTTNRILAYWVKQGLVIPEGKARATRYRIRRPAEEARKGLV